MKECTNIKIARKHYGEKIALRLLKAINFIESSSNLKALINNRIYNFHKLSGDRKNQYAIDIGSRRDGYRLILEFDQDDVFVKALRLTNLQSKKWGITMSNFTEYKNLIAFHPGSYVEDLVADLNISQKEFASRLGVSAKTISTLINAESNLSIDLALKLEKLTGIDYQTWINLQNNYDKKKLEIENEKIKDEDIVLDKIDFKYFKKNGLVEDKKYKRSEKKDSLYSTLYISSLTYLSAFNPLVSYRNNDIDNLKSVVNSNIMLCLAENIARNMSQQKLDISKLNDYLPEIKAMNLEEYEDFMPRLKQLLMECGIVLVTLPHLSGSGLNGACKIFKNGSVLLLVTDKNKRADIFWFSLMHELGHIINKDFYTDLYDIETYEKKEKIADKFSEEIFLSESEYEEFKVAGDFSYRSLVEFAKRKSIMPSILIGRLKNDKLIEQNKLNDLNKYYKFSIDMDK